MATLLMPVQADISAYDFQIDLEGSLYTFTFRYNERMDRWIMDIADENEVPLILGTPVLTNFTLVNRFKTVGLPPGDFVALNEANDKVQPGRADFGNDVKLFYIESV